MLRPILPPSRALRDERGFTLVELLVVMVAGIVVLGALYTILDVTMRQTTRTFSTVDAAQTLRVGMEQVENELHSACLGAQVTPIQTGSSSNSLIVLSQYGSTGSPANAASLTPVQHTITYNSTTGSLVDTTTAASGGTAPNWTFGGASTTKTLLTNVAPYGGGSGPIFQYFAYAQPMNGSSPYVDAGGNPYEMLIDGINAVPGTTPAVVPAAAPLTVPLSSTDAQSAAEVLIKLQVKPSGGSNVNTNLSSAAASVADQVVLRLTPPDNHAGAGATFNPCQ
jgi:prepilin-type N-terminal cleavage/methylation domain-containing protein